MDSTRAIIALWRLCVPAGLGPQAKQLNLSWLHHLKIDALDTFGLLVILVLHRLSYLPAQKAAIYHDSIQTGPTCEMLRRGWHLRFHFDWTHTHGSSQSFYTVPKAADRWVVTPEMEPFRWMF